MNQPFSQLRYVQEQLEKVGYSGWITAAKATKVPFGTIKRIGYGETENPRSQTIDKLAAHFRTQEKRKAA